MAARLARRRLHAEASHIKITTRFRWQAIVKCVLVVKFLVPVLSSATFVAKESSKRVAIKHAISAHVEELRALRVSLESIGAMFVKQEPELLRTVLGVVSVQPEGSLAVEGLTATHAPPGSTQQAKGATVAPLVDPVNTRTVKVKPAASLVARVLTLLEAQVHLLALSARQESTHPTRDPASALLAQLAHTALARPRRAPSARLASIRIGLHKLAASLAPRAGTKPRWGP